MKNLKLLATLLIAIQFALYSCDKQNTEPTPDKEDTEDTTTVVVKDLSVKQMDRPAWTYINPMKIDPAFSVTHEAQKLEFFGWGLEEDAAIYMEFPEETDSYNRAILKYRMGGWNEGPADWDMTTQIMVLDKESGEYYEISRAFTPYGGSFGSDWYKEFYIDVTEFLPMLTGNTEFRVFYCGWDATATNAHTATMTFNLYEEFEPVRPKTIYHSKIYDSRYDHNGYRGWYYGSDSLPIESDTYLGYREFTVPENVQSLVMRVNITGHGMEQGTFPDRENYETKNAAEFDENTYQVIINGENMGTGTIYYSNSLTYPQAGTYKYDRANWGPGLPAQVHFWQIDNIPLDRKISVDLDLERYISPSKAGLAYYIVQVDIFGLDDCYSEE